MKRESKHLRAHILRRVARSEHYSRERRGSKFFPRDGGLRSGLTKALYLDACGLRVLQRLLFVRYIGR
jgi:hypothetical protein